MAFSDAMAYLVVLIVSAIDFWITKNIVGRKLVNMRYWFDEITP